MIGAMQQQLDFIAYIQRLLVEGDFSATYKLALLHAIADICVEQHAVIRAKRISYRVTNTGRQTHYFILASCNAICV